MEIVTGLGNTVTCSSDENIDLFDCARGGLGQCGFIASVTIPLLPAPKKISLFKLLYHAKDVHALVKDIQLFVSSGHTEMIHAFLDY